MRNKKRVFMAILTMAVLGILANPLAVFAAEGGSRAAGFLCNFLGACTACSCHLSGSYYKRGIQFTVPGNSYGRASVFWVCF